MSDAPVDPSSPEAPRREFRFKSREFVPDNPPASTPSADPTDVREHFLAANQPPRIQTPAPPVRENEIHAILRDNLAAANAAGLNDLKPIPRRRSKRRRDFWIVIALVNSALATVGLLFRHDPIVLVFALAAFMLFNIKFAWSVWMVMDDY